MRVSKKIAIILFLVFAIMCFFSSLMIFSVKNAYANETVETIEQKMERFTSTDLLDGENDNGITIQNFATNYKDRTYVPIGHRSEDYPITEILGKAIPIELFYDLGVHIHMGKEYGFIVNTEESMIEDGYVSEFLIIDFNVDFETQGQIVNELAPTYKMELILQAKVKTKLNENNEWVVYYPWVGEEFYIALREPYIAFNLENENELNAFDNNYDINNDNGGIISKADLNFLSHKQINFFELEEKRRLLLKYVGWGSVRLSIELFELASPTKIINTVKNLLEDTYSVLEAVENYKNDFVEATKDETNAGVASIFSGENTKDKHKSSNGYFVREIYVLNNDSEKDLYISGENSEAENDFLELLITANEVATNSRCVFSSGFEVAFMTEYGTEIVVLNEDGEYELVSEATGLEAELITQACDYKVVRTNDDNVKRIKSVNYIENTNDDIADAPAYLLNGTGYQLYKFEPIAESQINEQWVFGNYRFYTNTIAQTLPAIRIHIFQSEIDGVSIDIKRLCNKTQEELLNDPYLVAYNNQSSVDLWSLDYNFTENASNTYYILYTYRFNYSGGSTPFSAEYKFMPQEITETLGVSNKDIGEGEDCYFRFSPLNNGNYVVNAVGYTNVTIQICKERPGDLYSIAQKVGENLEALLDKDYTYYVRIINNYSLDMGSISIVGGSVVSDNETTYSALENLENKYYKFIPTDFTGTYDIVCNRQEHSVVCYDSNLNEVEQNENGFFLTRNSVYYIEISNIGASGIDGKLSILYQYDITCFNSKLEILTDGYKQYYAYIIEATNVNGLSMVATVMLNGTVIFSGTYIGEEEIIVDLSNVEFIGGNNVLYASIVLNGNTDNPATVPAKEINTNNFTLQSSSYSGENIYILCGNAPIGSKNLTIASSTKVLIIDAVTSQTYNNIYFTIESGSSPLVIYFINVGNPVTFVAPQIGSAITSNRDLIINCIGNVTFKGGNGKDNGSLYDIEGGVGINMHDNTLVLNGNGSIAFYGGNGGSKDGDFTGGAYAGKGGSAIEVGNLVINISNFSAHGGNGGNGGKGPDGANGANGVNAGEAGLDGSFGGYGADGGNGGLGVWILDDYCAIYTNTVDINGGNGGNGGAGGKGGNGGNGAKGAFIGNGGRGGDGANGGLGGDAGQGAVAFNTHDINKIVYFDNNCNIVDLPQYLINDFNARGDNGKPGDGGAAGVGGTGGEKGFIGSPGANGTDGRPGASGV